MSKKKEIQKEEKPKGPKPRGLREQVKGGWLTAGQALEELKAKDPKPSLSMVNWLIRRGAK